MVEYGPSKTSKDTAETLNELYKGTEEEGKFTAREASAAAHEARERATADGDFERGIGWKDNGE